MVHVEVVVLLGLLGAAFGSFAGAVAWRMHNKRTFVSDRSECESCHHKLGPLDLVPIFSWLFLRGKCRFCGAAIGWTPFLTEVCLAILFVLSYVYWPLGFGAWQAITLFGLWLVYLVVFAILVVYDTRWMLLPDQIVLPLIGIAFVDAGLRISLVPGTGVVDYVLYVGWGVLALAGIYGALYAVSRGKWVGFGDVKLAVFIGVALGWQAALLVFMLANVGGFLVAVPGLATGTLTPSSRIPFGPFLMAGFFVAGLWGEVLIDWYFALAMWGYST